jgi:hypothetical protein
MTFSCHRLRSIPLVSGREDQAMVPRATFRGFEIVSLGRRVARFDGEEERLPELFVRGARIYTANLNRLLRLSRPARRTIKRTL